VVESSHAAEVQSEEEEVFPRKLCIKLRFEQCLGCLYYVDSILLPSESICATWLGVNGRCGAENKD
jgi:hypothetical protein